MLNNTVKILIVYIIAWQSYANDDTKKIKIDTKNNRFGIIFLGDTGDINKHKDNVANAIEKFCTTNDCDIGLLLGDNFYETGVASVDDIQFKTKFETPYKNLHFKFYPVLGNHDVLGNWQAQIDYVSKRWQMGGRFYIIDAGLVEIFALDTNVYSAHDATKNIREKQLQKEWLNTELQNSNAVWKIVYGHHPIYSSGMHGPEHNLALDINPLLVTNSVDFYLAGHDHDKEVIEKNNINYIIAGTGSRLRVIKKSADSLFAKSSFGFGHLLLTPETAILTIVDENGSVEFEKVYQR